MENIPPSAAKYPFISRRNALRLITAATAGSLLDAAWLEPGSLSITRREVESTRLPPALDGIRVALLADFHFRPGVDDPLLEKVIAAVKREKPDLIALAGDFCDSDPAVYVPLMRHLGRLECAHGIFAVMGNHDGWNADRTLVRQHFEHSGISFLLNQHSLISVRGETLAIAGTDFVWHGRPDPEKSCKGIAKDTPILALVHEPDFFDTFTSHRDVLLQLSGHTHGGQCQVPLIGYAPVSVKYGKNYNHGLYQRGASQLFVTRGVGTTGPRVRFSCPPELAVLTLRHSVGV